MTGWQRYVALGDSLTEGVGDPVAGGRLRGWADRLATGLGQTVEGFEYFNLARLGARTEQVRHDQLPGALELQPDLASVLSGMNDALSPNLDLDACFADLTAMLTQLQNGGAFVFTACLPRSVPALRILPKPARRRIETRLEQVSEVARDAAAETKSLCLDIDAFPKRYGLDVCSIDGFHPNSRGHLLIAQAFAEELSAHTEKDIVVPIEREAWLTTSTRHLKWLVTGGHLRRPPFLRSAGAKPR